jgi:hypothetical protein
MPPAPETPLELTAEHIQIPRRLSLNLKAFAGLSLLQALIWVGVALILWFSKGEFWSGLLYLLIGGATAVAGLIALSSATDALYIAEVPAYNRNHLGNTARSITDYLGVVFFLGLLLTVILVLARF